MTQVVGATSREKGRNQPVLGSLFSDLRGVVDRRSGDRETKGTESPEWICHSAYFNDARLRQQGQLGTGSGLVNRISNLREIGIVTQQGLRGFQALARHHVSKL